MNCGENTQWDIIHLQKLKKKIKFNGSRKDYIDGGNPGKEKQMVHVFSHLWLLALNSHVWIRNME